MIHITDKHKCCGCEACVQRCPKQCISMNEDYEGFLYPKVDLSVCIDCGLCEKVCPELNILPEKQPLKVLGAKLKDKDIVLKSSSGGIFTFLAHKILNDGGVVFGARFDEEWNVVHDFTETKEGLEPFRKSKYVQSRIGNTFKIAEYFLKQGRKVLFTGTPCQIKALKLFLRKNYDNLLAVDIACHSVPSPKIWKLYLNQLLRDNNLKQRDILFIDFRDKRNGWGDYSFVVKHTNGEILLPAKATSYMIAFLSNLSIRPSCESCIAKCGKSNSDLTIADFWGVDTINSVFYDNIGVSLVVANSEGGFEYIKNNNIELIETTLEECIKYNAGLKPDFVVHKKRNKYFSGIDRAEDFISYTKKYLSPSYRVRIKNKLKQIYKSLFK